MPAIDKSAVTGGVTRSEWYPDNGGRFEIRERVAATSTNNVSWLKLTQTLPARCRVIAAELRHATAMSVGGNDTTSTANRYGLITATSDAALTSTTFATNAALSNVVIASSSTSTASASVNRVFCYQGLAQTLVENTSTNEQFLYLAPIASQTATFRIGSVATTTASTSYVFSGTGQYDVLVYVEKIGALE